MSAGRRNTLAAFGLLQWCASHSPPDLVPFRDRQRVSVGTREFLKAREIDSLYVLACDARDRWQEAYDVVWEHQLAALREVVGALVDVGVRVLVFKGGELIPRRFPGHGLGFTADLDLLVQREQIELARSVLYKLDYRHAFFDRELRAMRDRDLRDIARIDLHHYELAPLARLVEVDAGAAVAEIAGRHDDQPLYLGPAGPVAVVEVDLHHNVASDAEAEMFFARAVPSSLGIGETFSAADHVWFNLSRYYNEVALHDKASLRPLAYTVPVVASGQVDWQVVERVAVEMALGPTLYYYLALCARLAPGCVPESVLAAAKGSTTSRVRDWGWQIGKLFDFEEGFPEYAFKPEPPP